MVRVSRLAAALAAAAACVALAVTAGALAQPQAPGQAGRRVYQERCAACHDQPETTRAPALSTLQRLPAEQIRLALTEGVMKAQAAGLSPQDLAAVVGFLANRDGGGEWIAKLMCPADKRDVDLTAKPTLSTWGVDYKNSRQMSAAQAGLTNADLAKLEVAWTIAFPQTAGLRSQGAIVGSTLFYNAGSARALLALDTRTGCAKWAYRPETALRSTLSFGDIGGRKAIVLADGRGQIHAVDAKTGTLIWKAEGRHDPGTPITGAPILYGDKIFVPVSASDVGRAQSAQYACCTTHGAVVALDAATGKQLWVYHTMEGAKPLGVKSSAGVAMQGPSGAPIWATPAIDEKRGLLYAGTGENTSPPATATSDSIVAIDLATGEGKWVRQTLANDIWNMSCPPSAKQAGPNCFFQEGYGSILRDFDFGAGPILAKRADGKDVVLAGQKSGHVWALDPDNGGKVLWSARFGEGTALGGVHWGMAVDGKRVFAPINDPMGDASSRPGLNALDITTGKVVWQFAPKPDCANGRDKRVPTCSYKIGISAAPMVVDQAVITGSLDGKVRIFEAATGKLLFDYDTVRPYETLSGVAGNGGSIDSHSVFAGDGMVFIGSGYGSFSQTAGNVLIAFRPKR